MLLVMIGVVLGVVFLLFFYIGMLGMKVLVVVESDFVWLVLKFLGLNGVVLVNVCILVGLLNLNGV